MPPTSLSPTRPISTQKRSFQGQHVIPCFVISDAPPHKSQPSSSIITGTPLPPPPPPRPPSQPPPLPLLSLEAPLINVYMMFYLTWSTLPSSSSSHPCLTALPNLSATFFTATAHMTPLLLLIKSFDHSRSSGQRGLTGGKDRWCVRNVKRIINHSGGTGGGNSLRRLSLSSKLHSC